MSFASAPSTDGIARGGAAFVQALSVGESRNPNSRSNTRKPHFDLRQAATVATPATEFNSAELLTAQDRPNLQR
jgi:hypothetical protein